MNRLTDIVILIRPMQWIKNTFVLLPLFFGGHLLDGRSWVAALVAMLCFCLASSAIYALNDTVDAPYDRRHPVKHLRPVASGAIMPRTALILAAVLGVSSLVLAALCPTGTHLSLTTVIGVYLLLNILYCLWLKHIVIIDVTVVAIGFVLRVVAGGLVCGIKLSPWIIIMTFLLSLLIVLGKRRSDVTIQTASCSEIRPTAASYTLPYLDAVLSMLSAVVVLAYVMYCLSPEVMERLRSEYVYVTALFVVAGILRYLHLAIAKGRGGAPTSLVLSDPFLRRCVAGWLLSFLFIIYIL